MKHQFRKRAVSAIIAGSALALGPVLAPPAAAVPGSAAVTLPFSFSFDFQFSRNTQDFHATSSGRVCLELRVTGSTDPDVATRDVIAKVWRHGGGGYTQVGSAASYRADGSYRSFCWSSSPNQVHHIELYKEWGPFARVWGDGHVKS